MKANPSGLGGKPNVFLSTGRDVAAHGEAVNRRLEAAGWTTLPLDYLEEGGHRRELIERCRAVVVLAGRHDVPSAKFDLDAAASLGIPVLVFTLDGTVRDELLARFVRGRLGEPDDSGRAVVAALEPYRSASPSVAPEAPSTPPGASAPADPVTLAWRLVVDSKADLDLLLHLDPQRLEDAIRKVESESNESPAAEWSSRLARVERRLAEKQPGLAPNALWHAFMREVHAAKVEALKRPPAARNVEPPAQRQVKAAPKSARPDGEGASFA